jgi:hypothetical protein
MSGERAMLRRTNSPLPVSNNCLNVSVTGMETSVSGQNDEPARRFLRPIGPHAAETSLRALLQRRRRDRKSVV